MFDITITGKLALFVALPTTFVLLYLLLRHTHVGRHFLRRWKKSARFLCHRLNIGQKFIADNDEEEEEDSKSTKCKSSMKIREIRIPSSATSAVIGTNRTTLEQIQRNYNVEIEILQDGDGACVSSSSRTQEMTVCVRGSSQATQQAELRILQIVEDVSTVSTEDMYIPASATIALIGKNSQSLRYINRVSGATVVVATTTSSSSMQLVSIEGSTEQRELAKKLINDTVDKNVTFHEDLTHTVAHSEGAAQTEVPPVPQGHLTKDAPTDLLEVMVVSVASPGHFWVHIRNENLPKLVTLQNDIEKYYSKPTHFKATQCSEVGVDDVVAVCLSKRCQWYRARITAVLHNTYRVFCLDYGYNEEVQKTDVCRLREEFLSLPFQAVECYLANVKPKDEGDWSESAYNSFENMVCINQSKILAGEIVRYQPTSHGLVPCLQLVDYDGPQVIWCNLWLRAFTKQAAAKSTNINEELVKTGHAEWSESPSDTVTVGKHKHSTLSQQVLQSEGFGSTESLTDPFLKSPPPEETPVSLPPANTGWADDFPWAWAYNEEESALGKNVCEMQTRLSNTASPTEEIRQPGAGDIKSLQETDALTKKTSETSALADHGEDSCNTASKAEEVSYGFFYNGICSDVDAGLVTSSSDHSVDQVTNNDSLEESPAANESLKLKYLAQMSPTSDSSDMFDSGHISGDISVSSPLSETYPEFAPESLDQSDDVDNAVYSQFNVSREIKPDLGSGVLDLTTSQISGESYSSDIHGGSISVLRNDVASSVDSTEGDQAYFNEEMSSLTTLEATDPTQSIHCQPPPVSLDLEQSAETLEVDEKQREGNPLEFPDNLLGTKDVVSRRDTNVRNLPEPEGSGKLLPVEADTNISLLDSDSTLKTSQENVTSGEAEQASLPSTGKPSETEALRPADAHCSRPGLVSNILSHSEISSDETESNNLNSDSVELKTDVKITDSLNSIVINQSDVPQGTDMEDQTESVSFDLHKTQTSQQHQHSTETPLNTETLSVQESDEALSHTGQIPLNRTSSPGENLSEPLPESKEDWTKFPSPLDEDKDWTEEPCVVLQEPSQDIIDSMSYNQKRLSTQSEPLENEMEPKDIWKMFYDPTNNKDLENKSFKSDQDIWMKFYENDEKQTRRTLPETDWKEIVSGSLEQDKKDLSVWSKFYSSQDGYLTAGDSSTIEGKQEKRDGATTGVMEHSPDSSLEHCDLHSNDTEIISLNGEASLEYEVPEKATQSLEYETTTTTMDFTGKGKNDKTEDLEYSALEEDNDWEEKDPTLVKVTTQVEEPVKTFSESWKQTESDPLEDADILCCDDQVSFGLEKTDSGDDHSLGETTNAVNTVSTVGREALDENLEYSALEEDNDWEEKDPTSVKETPKTEEPLETFSESWKDTTSDPLEDADILGTDDQIPEIGKSKTENIVREVSGIDIKSVSVETSDENLEYSALEEDNDWEEKDPTLVKVKIQVEEPVKTFSESWKDTTSDPLEDADILGTDDQISGAGEHPVGNTDTDVTRTDTGSEEVSSFTTESIVCGTFGIDIAAMVQGTLEDNLEYSALEEDNDWEEKDPTLVKVTRQVEEPVKTFSESWKQTESDPLEDADILSCDDQLSFGLEKTDSGGDHSLQETTNAVKTISTVGREALDENLEYSALEEDNDWEEKDPTLVKKTPKTEEPLETFSESWKDTTSDPLEDADILGTDDQIPEIGKSKTENIVREVSVIDIKSVSVEPSEENLEYSALEEDNDWEEKDPTLVKETPQTEEPLETFSESWKDTISDPLEDADILGTDDQMSGAVDTKQEDVDTKGISQKDAEYSENGKVTSENRVREISDGNVTSVRIEPSDENLEYSALEEDNDWEEKDPTLVKETTQAEEPVKTFSECWKQTESDPLEDADILSWDDQLSFGLEKTDRGGDHSLGETTNAVNTISTVGGEALDENLEYSALEEDNDWEEKDPTSVKETPKTEEPMETFSESWKDTTSDPLEDADILGTDDQIPEIGKSKTENIVREVSGIDIKSVSVEPSDENLEYSALEEDNDWEEKDPTLVKVKTQVEEPVKTFSESWKDTTSDPLEDADILGTDNQIPEIGKSKTENIVREVSGIDIKSVSVEPSDENLEYSALEEDNDWEEKDPTSVKETLQTEELLETFSESWKDTISDPLEDADILGTDDQIFGAGEHPVRNTDTDVTRTETGSKEVSSFTTESIVCGTFGIDIAAMVHGTLEDNLEYSALEEDNDWKEKDPTLVKETPQTEEPLETFSKSWKDTTSDPLEDADILGTEDQMSGAVDTKQEDVDTKGISQKETEYSENGKVTSENRVREISDGNVTSVRIEPSDENLEYSALEEDNDWEEKDPTLVKETTQAEEPVKTFSESWKDTTSDPLEDADILGTEDSQHVTPSQHTDVVSLTSPSKEWQRSDDNIFVPVDEVEGELGVRGASRILSDTEHSTHFHGDDVSQKTDDEIWSMFYRPITTEIYDENLEYSALEEDNDWEEKDPTLVKETPKTKEPLETFSESWKDTTSDPLEDADILGTDDQIPEIGKSKTENIVREVSGINIKSVSVETSEENLEYSALEEDNDWEEKDPTLVKGIPQVEEPVKTFSESWKDTTSDPLEDADILSCDDQLSFGLEKTDSGGDHSLGETTNAVNTISTVGREALDENLEYSALEEDNDWEEKDPTLVKGTPQTEEPLETFSESWKDTTSDPLEDADILGTDDQIPEIGKSKTENIVREVSGIDIKSVSVETSDENLEYSALEEDNDWEEKDPTLVKETSQAEEPVKTFSESWKDTTSDPLEDADILRTEDSQHVTPSQHTDVVSLTAPSKELQHSDVNIYVSVDEVEDELRVGGASRILSDTEHSTHFHGDDVSQKTDDEIWSMFYRPITTEISDENLEYSALEEDNDWEEKDPTLVKGTPQTEEPLETFSESWKDTISDPLEDADILGTEDFQHVTQNTMSDDTKTFTDVYSIDRQERFIISEKSNIINRNSTVTPEQFIEPDGFFDSDPTLDPKDPDIFEETSAESSSGIIKEDSFPSDKKQSGKSSSEPKVSDKELITCNDDDDDVWLSMLSPSADDNIEWEEEDPEDEEKESNWVDNTMSSSNAENGSQVECQTSAVIKNNMRNIEKISSDRTSDDVTVVSEDEVIGAVEEQDWLDEEDTEFVDAEEEVKFEFVDADDGSESISYSDVEYSALEEDNDWTEADPTLVVAQKEPGEPLETFSESWKQTESDPLEDADILSCEDQLSFGLEKTDSGGDHYLGGTTNVVNTISTVGREALDENLEYSALEEDNDWEEKDPTLVKETPKTEEPLETFSESWKDTISDPLEDADILGTGDQIPEIGKSKTENIVREVSGIDIKSVSVETSEENLEYSALEEDNDWEEKDPTLVKGTPQTEEPVKTFSESWKDTTSDPLEDADILGTEDSQHVTPSQHTDFVSLTAPSKEWQHSDDNIYVSVDEVEGELGVGGASRILSDTEHSTHFHGDDVSQKTDDEIWSMFYRPITTEISDENLEYSALEEDNDWEEKDPTLVKGTPQTEEPLETFSESWKDTISDPLEDADILGTEDQMSGAVDTKQEDVNTKGISQKEPEYSENGKVTSENSVREISDGNVTSVRIEPSDENLEYSALEEDNDWEEKDPTLVKVTTQVEEPVKTFSESWKQTESDPLEDADILSCEDQLSFGLEKTDSGGHHSFGETTNAVNTVSTVGREALDENLEYSALEEDNDWEEKDPTLVKGTPQTEEPLETFSESWKDTASDPLEDADILGTDDQIPEIDKSKTENIVRQVSGIDIKSVSVKPSDENLEYSALEEENDWEEKDPTLVKVTTQVEEPVKTFSESWKDTTSDPLEDADILGTEDSQHVTPSQHTDVVSLTSPSKEWQHSDDNIYVSVDEVEGELGVGGASRILSDTEHSTHFHGDDVSQKTDDEIWSMFYRPITTEISDENLEYSALEEDNDWEEKDPTLVKGTPQTEEPLETFSESWKDTISDPLEDADILGTEDQMSGAVDTKQEDVNTKGISQKEPEYSENGKVTSENSVREISDGNVTSVRIEPSDENLEYSALEEDNDWEEKDPTLVKVTTHVEEPVKTFSESWKQTESDPLEDADILSCEDQLSFGLEKTDSGGDHSFGETTNAVNTISTVGREALYENLEYSALEEDNDWEEKDPTLVKGTPQTEEPLETFSESWKDTTSDPLEDADILGTDDQIPEIGKSKTENIVREVSGIDRKFVSVEPSDENLEYSALEEDNDWEEKDPTLVKVTTQVEEPVKTFSESWKDTTSDPLEDADVLGTDDRKSLVTTAVNTDDNEVWDMYFTSRHRDTEWKQEENPPQDDVEIVCPGNGDFSEDTFSRYALSKETSSPSPPQETASDIDYSIDHRELFDWELREQIANTFSLKDRSHCYRDQPQYFSGSLDSWASSTGTMFTATPGHMSSTCASGTDTPQVMSNSDDEYLDAKDIFYTDEPTNVKVNIPMVSDDQSEVTECLTVFLPEDKHGKPLNKVEQEKAEAVQRKRIIEDEISLLLTEIIAMASERTKRRETENLSEQDVKAEGSQISQQITEIIQGMVQSNDNLEGKVTKDITTVVPQDANLLTEVDNAMASTDVVDNQETFSDEIVVPSETEARYVNLEVTEQMEQKLQNVASLYSNYAEDIPDTQLMLKLETLYFIEKMGKNKEKDNGGTFRSHRNENLSHQATDYFDNDRTEEFTHVSTLQQLEQFTDVAEKSSANENEEIFANVLMVELPISEETHVSQDPHIDHDIEHHIDHDIEHHIDHSIDNNIDHHDDPEISLNIPKDGEHSRFMSTLEIQLPGPHSSISGSNNRQAQHSRSRIDGSSPSSKRSKSRLSPGDRIARRWRRKSPSRNYSNALFVNLPNYCESSEEEFSRDVEESLLDDEECRRSLKRHRFSESGFPIETHSEMLKRLSSMESDCSSTSSYEGFRCTLHTFVPDYDMKNYHNIFVIPKRHGLYSTEVNLNISEPKEMYVRVPFLTNPEAVDTTGEVVCRKVTETIAEISSASLVSDSTPNKESEEREKEKEEKQEEEEMIATAKDTEEEEVSERSDDSSRNSVLIDFTAEERKTNQMSYFTEEQIQDMLKKVTETESVTQHSDYQIYCNSVSRENEFRYGTSSYPTVMSVSSLSEPSKPSKPPSDSDKTMLFTYSEMLLACDITSSKVSKSGDTEAKDNIIDDDTKTPEDVKDLKPVSMETLHNESQELTQTSEQLAIDLSSLLSVDSSEISSELSHDYEAVHRPKSPEDCSESSQETSSSDSDGDYPASRHLILEFSGENDVNSKCVEVQSRALSSNEIKLETETGKVSPDSEGDRVETGGDGGEKVTLSEQVESKEISASVVDTPDETAVLTEHSSCSLSEELHIKDTILETGDTQTECSDTQTECSDTQTECSDTQTEISDAQTEYGDTRTEISDAQTEISDTQTECDDTQTETGDTQTECSDTQTECDETQTECDEGKISDLEFVDRREDFFGLTREQIDKPLPSNRLPASNETVPSLHDGTESEISAETVGVFEDTEHVKCLDIPGKHETPDIIKPTKDLEKLAEKETNNVLESVRKEFEVSSTSSLEETDVRIPENSCNEEPVPDQDHSGQAPIPITPSAANLDYSEDMSTRRLQDIYDAEFSKPKTGQTPPESQKVELEQEKPLESCQPSFEEFSKESSQSEVSNGERETPRNQEEHQSILPDKHLATSDEKQETDVCKSQSPENEEFSKEAESSAKGVNIKSKKKKKPKKKPRFYALDNQMLMHIVDTTAEFSRESEFESSVIIPDQSFLETPDDTVTKSQPEDTVTKSQPEDRTATDLETVESVTTSPPPGVETKIESKTSEELDCFETQVKIEPMMTESPVIHSAMVEECSSQLEESEIMVNSREEKPKVEEVDETLRESRMSPCKELYTEESELSLGSECGAREIPNPEVTPINTAVTDNVDLQSVALQQPEVFVAESSTEPLCEVFDEERIETMPQLSVDQLEEDVTEESVSQLEETEAEESLAESSNVNLAADWKNVSKLEVDHSTCVLNTEHETLAQLEMIETACLAIATEDQAPLEVEENTDLLETEVSVAQDDSSTTLTKLEHTEVSVDQEDSSTTLTKLEHTDVSVAQDDSSTTLTKLEHTEVSVAQEDSSTTLTKLEHTEVSVAQEDSREDIDTVQIETETLDNVASITDVEAKPSHTEMKEKLQESLAAVADAAAPDQEKPKKKRKKKKSSLIQVSGEVREKTSPETEAVKDREHTPGIDTGSTKSEDSKHSAEAGASDDIIDTLAEDKESTLHMKDATDSKCPPEEQRDKEDNQTKKRKKKKKKSSLKEDSRKSDKSSKTFKEQRPDIPPKDAQHEATAASSGEETEQVSVRKPGVDTDYPKTDRQLSSEEELQKEFVLESNEERTDECVYSLLPSESEIDVTTHQASMQEDVKGELVVENIERTSHRDDVSLVQHKVEQFSENEEKNSLRLVPEEPHIKTKDDSQGDLVLPCKDEFEESVSKLCNSSPEEVAETDSRLSGKPAEDGQSGIRQGSEMPASPEIKSPSSESKKKRRSPFPYGNEEKSLLSRGIEEFLHSSPQEEPSDPDTPTLSFYPDTPTPTLYPDTPTPTLYPDTPTQTSELIVAQTVQCSVRNNNFSETEKLEASHVTTAPENTKRKKKLKRTSQIKFSENGEVIPIEKKTSTESSVKVPIEKASTESSVKVSMVEEKSVEIKRDISKIETKVSQTLSKVSSAISKKAQSVLEDSPIKRKKSSSSNEESPDGSKTGENKSRISKLSKKKSKHKELAAKESLSEPHTKKESSSSSTDSSAEHSQKEFPAEAGKSVAMETAEEKTATRTVATESSKTSSLEIVKKCPKKESKEKEEPSSGKVSKSVVDKISSLVTSITKQVTDSLEELSTHKKKKLKQSSLLTSDSKESAENKSMKENTESSSLTSKNKTNKKVLESSLSEKSTRKTEETNSNSKQKSQKGNSSSKASPLLSKKQQKSKRDAKNIPMSLIKIESPYTQHTYLPLIQHLTEEEAAFSDTTPLTTPLNKRKKKKRRKNPHNLSQLSTATESSCEIDTALWLHKNRTSRDSSARGQKTRPQRPTILVSEDTSAASPPLPRANSTPPSRRAGTPTSPYLSVDPLGHSRSRSRCRRSPMKELLWLSEQEMHSDRYDSDTTSRRTGRSVSNINRISRINLAYISTGTRVRKRRKKNIIAVS